MKLNHALLSMVVAALIHAPLLHADNQEDSFMLDDISAQEEAQPINTKEIELGGAYSSADSTKFGEYSGLTKSQGFVVGNINIRHRDAYDSGSGHYWNFIGSDLGLDFRSLQIEYGQQSKFKVFAGYDQLVHNTHVGAQTPFLGVGTTQLTLPSDWVPGTTTSGMDLLNASLKNVDITTERKNYFAGLFLNLPKHWTLSMDMSHEDKDGLESIGATFGISGFNPLSAVLPKPIDQETNDFDIKLAFNGDQSQFQLRYRLSLFDNRIDSLNWQNPYQLRLPSNTGFLDDQGGISLAPDNQAHHIKLSGAYRLGRTTRLSGGFSYGLMFQDEKFRDYTVNPALNITTPLPRNSADARVETRHANLVFTTRPMKRMDVRASYIYDQRDNETPINEYAVLRNDSENQISSLTSKTIRINQPYGRQQHKFKADVGYRVLPKTKISMGYGYNRNDRQYSQVEVTDEHSGNFKISTSPFSSISSWVKYEYSVRNGSGYRDNQLFLDSHTEQFLETVPVSLRFENDPLLRQYNISDRVRNKATFSTTWLALDTVDVSFMGRYVEDDYDSVRVGLKQSTNISSTLDINYNPNEMLSLYGFFSYEYFKNIQRGFRRFSNTQALALRDPANNWKVKTSDDIYTVGTGIEWQVIKDKLEIGFDYTFSNAITETNTKAGSNLSNLLVPDLTTSLHSLRLRGDYQLQRNIRLRLSYRYELLDTNDFALDNVNESTIDDVLSLGNRSPNYNAHIIAVSVIYNF